MVEKNDGKIWRRLEYTMEELLKSFYAGTRRLQNDGLVVLWHPQLSLDAG